MDTLAAAVIPAVASDERTHATPDMGEFVTGLITVPLIVYICGIATNVSSVNIEQPEAINKLRNRREKSIPTVGVNFCDFFIFAFFINPPYF